MKASTPTEWSQRFWRSRSSVLQFGASEGWIDKGERAAIGFVASEVRGRPVLDLGVGGGRTVSLMRLLTDEYVGIDWAPEMVAVCRSQHPQVDIRQGDARDLSAFPAASFKLVLFSYNGIDLGLNHNGRREAIAEINRVLEPGGIFLYSTLSMLGRCFGQRPWHPMPWRTPDDGRLDGERLSNHPLLRRLGRFVFQFPSQVRRYPTLYRNWWHNLELVERNRDWATAPFSAVDYHLAHFTTIEGERAILAQQGFVISQIFTSYGTRVEDGLGMNSCPWFSVIARKRDA